MSKVAWGTSHLLLLLLLLLVVVRRLVSRCGEVVRSIALVVHHIQTTHSDGPELLVGRETRWDLRRAVSPELSVPPYMPERIQWPCRPVCVQTMRVPLRAPPAPPGATNGSKRYKTHSVKKKKETLIRQPLIGWVIPSLLLRSFPFGEELYLERAGAIYSRPPRMSACMAQWSYARH